MAEGESDWDEERLVSAMSSIRSLTLTDSETGEREVITVTTPVRNQETGEPEAFPRGSGWLRPSRFLYNPNRGCWGNSWSASCAGLANAAIAEANTGGPSIDEETGEPLVQDGALAVSAAQPRNSSFHVPRHMLLGMQPMISQAITTETAASTSTIVASIPNPGFLPSFCRNRKRPLTLKPESEAEEPSTSATNTNAGNSRFKFCKLPRFRERAQHVAWALFVLMLLIVVSTFGFILTCVICMHLHRHYLLHSEDEKRGPKQKNKDMQHKYAQCFWYGHVCRVCREEAAAERFTRLHFRDAKPSAGLPYKADLLGAKHFTCCG